MDMFHRIASAGVGMGITGLVAATAEAAISEGSYLSIGLAIAAIGAVAVATWHIRGGIERNRAELKRINEEQQKMLKWMDDQRHNQERDLKKENQRLRDELHGGE